MASRRGNAAGDDSATGTGGQGRCRRWRRNSRRRNSQAVGQDQVGATVGEEIRKSAIIASLLSLFGILVYVAFRYEFSFAVGAVVAVIHDVLMTIGWYCIANVSGREFNATVVAAMLTIIGFSINDKIVIFDRIREDLKLGVRGTFKEVINQALNQTLSRTIITSGTVFLATAVALYLRRRRHQRLRLHLPGRHHHRHLFEHLHRQRDRAVVAQGPAARTSARRRRRQKLRRSCEVAYGIAARSSELPARTG